MGLFLVFIFHECGHFDALGWWACSGSNFLLQIRPFDVLATYLDVDVLLQGGGQG